MTDTTQPIAKLRHLYRNMVLGGVKDADSAKRIAEGLLGPAIAALEAHVQKLEQIEHVTADVSEKERESNMPDLTALTERGAKAWAGVDAAALREGAHRLRQCQRCSGGESAPTRSNWRWPKPAAVRQ